MRAARVRTAPAWVRIAVPCAALLAAAGMVAVFSGVGGSGHTAAVQVPREPRTTTTTTATTSTTTTTPPQPEPVPEPPPEPPQPSVPRPVAPPPPTPPPPPPGPRVRVVTYSIVTDGPVVSDVEELAAVAADVYADPRGWSSAGIEFARVGSGGDFTIVLAHPEAVPPYAPGVCDSTYSCQAGRYVVLNDERWSQGSPAWPGPLAEYRKMVLNHETGHWLGLGHATCPQAGDAAPVMQQQSIALQGCAPNPWPLGWELGRVRR